MKELTFYTHPMSRGRIVRWMLEEVGEPYDTVLLDFASTMKEPAFIAMNPMGKVPVIRHRDTVVSEAAAICAYLADTFPKKKLAPPPDQRGAYYRWLFFAAGPLEAAVTAKALGLLAPADKRAMAGYGSFETTMDTLEAAVAGREYVAADHFTAADVYVGSQVGWGLMFGTIEKRPAFTAYVERLRARPAAQRASALDDAAMPKKA
jgi:glutathione S-transferase